MLQSVLFVKLFNSLEKFNMISVTKSHDKISTISDKSDRLMIEAYLIEVAQCANTAKVDQVTPDRVLECLIMPSKPGSPFSTRTLHKFLRINIVGNVSPFPHPGSLRLCSAFGLLWHTNRPKDTTLATTFGW